MRKRLIALILVLSFILSAYSAQPAESPADPGDIPDVEIGLSEDEITVLKEKLGEDHGRAFPDVPGEAAEDEKIKISVLILPKFETGEMKGDLPGEAQFYYEAYLDGGEEYDVPGAAPSSKLYVKDGIALCLTGMGKVNGALTTAAVLSDERFDFSDAYIISTGCAGAAMGYGVMGDVFVVTAMCDFDLGHHADPREMQDSGRETWFHATDYDEAACVRINEDLAGRVYDLVKDIPLETTELTRGNMDSAFDGAEWAVRDPAVLRGTAVTGDNYWKGGYDHRNALLIVETYGCPDPFAVTEMEDVAVGLAVKRQGMLDRLIVLRGAVNMDVFMNGAAPEDLWDDYYDSSISTTDDAESADIFETAMKNNFDVGSVIIEAVLHGGLQ